MSNKQINSYNLSRHHNFYFDLPLIRTNFERNKSSVLLWQVGIIILITIIYTIKYYYTCIYHKVSVSIMIDL